MIWHAIPRCRAHAQVKANSVARDKSGSLHEIMNKVKKARKGHGQLGVVVQLLTRESSWVARNPISNCSGPNWKSTMKPVCLDGSRRVLTPQCMRICWYRSKSKTMESSDFGNVDIQLPQFGDAVSSMPQLMTGTQCHQCHSHHQTRFDPSAREERRNTPGDCQCSVPSWGIFV